MSKNSNNINNNINNNAAIEEPTIGTNLEKTAAIGVQAVNNNVAMLLNNVANIAGVDPSVTTDVIVEQIKQKIQNLNNILQGPQGRQLLSDLSDLGSKLIITAEKPIKESQRVFNEMIIEQLNNFEKIAWGAIGIIPLVGDVSELIRVAKDLLHAFTKAMKAVAGITGASSTFLENTRSIIDEKAALFTNMANLVQNVFQEGNNTVNNMLTMASNDLTEQAKYIVKQQKDMSKNYASENMRKGGAAKIRKRTNKSIARFLSSNVTSYQIKKKYSAKRKTTRRRRV